MSDDAPRIIPPQGGSGTAPPRTGGPAFPRPTSDQPGSAGMQLRDYFAAAALQGMLAWSPEGAQVEGPPWFGQTSPKTTAELAYAYADAMLAERAKQ